MDYQAALQEWVERTCKEQGVPAKVADIATVLKVAAILCEASDAPNRLQAPDVDVLRPGGGRAHNEVIEHGGDHGALLVQVEVGPSSLEVGALVDERAE